MRKFISMILAVALPCAIFTSCNDDDDDDNGGLKPDVPEETTDPYAAVDLGLSVLWAEYNVDATKAEDYGGYYAWGETEQKTVYGEENYEFYDEATDSYNCPAEISGTKYDVAHTKWGGDWRIPTSAECQELVNNCTWVRNSLNGVNGYTVTGPNGNSIFLPAAGYKLNSTLNYDGDNGSYWTSNANVQSEGDAYYIVMGSRYRVDYSWAFAGQSVRPVKTPKK